MTERTFDIEVSDEIGLVLPGGTHIAGGFTGTFIAVFEYDERPYIDRIELDLAVGGKRIGLDTRSDLFKQIEASIMKNFAQRIDEAWQEECQARSRREEMSDRAYSQWQVL